MKNKLVTEKWSSRAGFIIATAGAAIGLGNIWRFPYMAGTQGGGAFVIVFLACILLVGIPIMLAEMSIGRKARKNPVSALSELAQANKHSKHWRIVGGLGAFTSLLILSFYTVVGGWSIYYLLKAVSGSFNHASTQDIEGIWTNLVSSPLQMALWHTVFMALTVCVIVAGVVKGIERATKIMMPALYVMLVVLVIYASTTGYFLQAWHFLFDFRLSQLTTTVVIAALGHAFFSLAVGVGALLIYAAYTPAKSKLVSSVFIVVVLDVLVAILAGLAIFPLVFRFHLPLNSGPGLMYEALPIAFSHLLAGQWIGTAFFLLLLFAAWTSSINLAEPVVSVVRDWFDWSRTRAAIAVGITAWAVGLLSALSFNTLSGVQLQGANLFTMISNLATDILCPLGGIGFSLFAGWVMSRQDNEASLQTGPMVFHLWYILIRYLAPIAIITIFISLL
jgi:neurotransmitter:Na+ symporter, NSS family